MVRGAFLAICLIMGVLLTGCAASGGGRSLPRSVIIVVPGSDGAGWWADGVFTGVCQARPESEVQLMRWGVPLGVLPNMRFQPLHDDAEGRLTRKLVRLREERPGASISLVGHSGGCGVILESLAMLPRGVTVDHVVLLAPAVSEGYDLWPAMPHLRGMLHVFHSRRDEVLPSTWAAGSYDNVWGNAAGVVGFTNVLPPAMRSHLRQHEHRQAWADLGCSGGHFGWRNEEFVRRVVGPLLVWPLGPANR